MITSVKTTRLSATNAAVTVKVDGRKHLVEVRRELDGSFVTREYMTHSPIALRPSVVEMAARLATEAIKSA